MNVETKRRGFLKGVVAACSGGLALLVPAGTGLRVFLDPLRRRSGGGAFVRVTGLNAVPSDGVPRRFAVIADQVNAWNRRKQVPIGAVYLRRTGEGQLHALNVICPHAGCLVDYTAAGNGFLCPCHNSTFALDGAVNDPKSPSPRGLDELEVEVRNEDEIWVRFQNYRTAIQEKVPA